MSNSFCFFKLSAVAFSFMLCSQIGSAEVSHKLQTCVTVQTNGQEQLLTKTGPVVQDSSTYHVYASVSANDDVFVVGFDHKGQILKDPLPQFVHVSGQGNFIKLNLAASKVAKKAKFFVVAMPAESSQSKELQKALEKKNYSALNLAQSKALYNRLIHWNEAAVGHGGPTVEQLGASRSTTAHTINPGAANESFMKDVPSQKARPPAPSGGGRAISPTFDWRAKAKTQSYGSKQPKTFIFEIKQ